MGTGRYRSRPGRLAARRTPVSPLLRSRPQRFALEALSNNAETLTHLSPEKRTELNKRAKESGLLARVAVCNHVNVLFVPTASGLDAVELDVVTQASVRPNQTDAILERLAAMDKTLAAGDKPLDPGYVRSKLGALLDAAQPTQEFVRAFARRTDLKMVLDRAQLVGLISAGVRNGVWEYHDPERGDDGWAARDRPATSVRLAEDTFVYPVGTAPARAEEACPFCGGHHPGKGCPDAGGGTGFTGTGKKAPTAGTVFSGAGAGGKAFIDARATAAEAGRTTLRELTVKVDHVGPGAGTELARLHTVVAPGHQGVRLVYDVQVLAVLSNPDETAEIRFHGTPADYTPLREALKQLLGPRQATLRAEVHAVFDDPPPLSGDEVNRLVQAATDTGPTKCTVTLLTEGDG